VITTHVLGAVKFGFLHKQKDDDQQDGAENGAPVLSLFVK
jgi:hypothetical protein